MVSPLEGEDKQNGQLSHPSASDAGWEREMNSSKFLMSLSLSLSSRASPPPIAIQKGISPTFDGVLTKWQHIVCDV